MGKRITLSSLSYTILAWLCTWSLIFRRGKPGGNQSSPLREPTNQLVVGYVMMLNHLIGGDVADMSGLIQADARIVGWSVLVAARFVAGQFRLDAMNPKLPTGQIGVTVAGKFQLQTIIEAIELLSKQNFPELFHALEANEVEAPDG